MFVYNYSIIQKIVKKFVPCVKSVHCTQVSLQVERKVWYYYETL